MKIALFFTRGVSLEQWVASGLFDREKLIYECHLKDKILSEVHWFTYGHRDLDVAERLYEDKRLDRRVIVWPMPIGFAWPKVGSWLYSFMLPWVHRRVIAGVDVLKTNQLDGGWAAAYAKRRSGQPLVVRCGYVQSKLEHALNRLSPWRMILMKLGEQKTYRSASVAVVASRHDAQYVEEIYDLNKRNIYIIPNYINIDSFSPAKAEIPEKNRRRFLFVGRLSEQKNLLNLICAIAAAELGLDIVGSGPLESVVRKVATENAADVRLLGSVPNKNLPSLLNQYKYFVLASLVEGMPKTLLEAMACGLICVGTDVEGINEVVHDGENGFLAKGTDIESIKKALTCATIEGKPNIGIAARQTVLDKYTIDTCVAAERDILFSLTTTHSKPVGS